MEIKSPFIEFNPGLICDKLLINLTILFLNHESLADLNLNKLNLTVYFNINNENKAATGPWIKVVLIEWGAWT